MDCTLACYTGGWGLIPAVSSDIVFSNIISPSASPQAPRYQGIRSFVLIATSINGHQRVGEKDSVTSC